MKHSGFIILKRLISVSIILAVMAGMFLCIKRDAGENASGKSLYTQLYQSMKTDAIKEIITYGSSVYCESVAEEIMSNTERVNNEIEEKYQDVTEAIAYALRGDEAVYKVTFDELPESDDGIAYLYALAPYEYAVTKEMSPIGEEELIKKQRFQFPLGFETEDTRLYEKFCICVMQKGELVQVTDAKYIINPEVLAQHTRPYEPIEKGLQSLCMHNLYLDGSGQDQGAYLPVICLLASLDENNPTVHPAARDEDFYPMEHYMYMLNADTSEGVEALAKDCSAIAAAGGQTFIIGNEVNERIWNYESLTDWPTYVRHYTQAFRVCYNAIKSQNAEAKVYFSIGQDWNRNRPVGHGEYYRYMDETDFCDLFNAQMKAEGNVDWAVALHPYIVPLTYSKFWDMSGCESGGYCKAQVDSNAMVSFQNMSVITDYLTTDEYLNPDGEPRYFIIGEMGLSNEQGGDVQAAALCALWASYQMNPYVHELIYCNLPGYGVDPIFIDKAEDAWAALGTEKEEEYMEWAKEYIGITDWTEVIRE